MGQGRGSVGLPRRGLLPLLLLLCWCRGCREHGRAAAALQLDHDLAPPSARCARRHAGAALCHRRRQGRGIQPQDPLPLRLLHHRCGGRGSARPAGRPSLRGRSRRRGEASLSLVPPRQARSACSWRRRACCSARSMCRWPSARRGAGGVVGGWVEGVGAGGCELLGVRRWQNGTATAGSPAISCRSSPPHQILDCLQLPPLLSTARRLLNSLRLACPPLRPQQILDCLQLQPLLSKQLDLPPSLLSTSSDPGLPGAAARVRQPADHRRPRDQPARGWVGGCGLAGRLPACLACAAAPARPAGAGSPVLPASPALSTHRPSVRLAARSAAGHGQPARSIHSALACPPSCHPP